MFIPLLAARGPVTAVGTFFAVATASAGYFFRAFRQQAIDCADGSGATDGQCATDIIATVVSALMAIGSVAGATAVGLTSPTPRDIMATNAVFRIDGVDIDWTSGMLGHKTFGLNRTFSNPAVVEWQYNTTTPIQTYETFSKDDHLYQRHRTGIMMDDPSASRLWARSQCEAYIDVVTSMDSLKNSEYAQFPSHASLLSFSQDLFNHFANNGINSECIFFGTSDGVAGAKIDFGASCSQAEPGPHACLNAVYDTAFELINT